MEPVAGARQRRVARPTKVQLRVAAQRFALLVLGSRLRMVYLLAQRPYTVAQLAAETGQTTPAVGKQVAKLRAADVVTVRHSGRPQLWILSDARLADLVDLLLAPQPDL